MNPVNYITNKERFEQLRTPLNKALSFTGINLGEDGKLFEIKAVSTIKEAEERAKSLKLSLEGRNVHPDVLKFCRAKLLQDNYFHAVLETTKSIADKIRVKSGLGSDGSQLVDVAFALGKNNVPVLAFNKLTTCTEKSEHKGLANLLKGIFGAFRNTTAHEAKLNWKISEEDALDILSLASLIHRKLDTVFLFAESDRKPS